MRATWPTRSSLSGDHVFDVAEGERWILEQGVYWASEGGVGLGFAREPAFASLWAGDGLLTWKTKLAGQGRVAINAPGPVGTLDIDGELRVPGRLVLGRTDGLRYRFMRSACFPRNFISSQKRVRVFEGRGRVMVAWPPYWNQYMYTQGNRIWPWRLERRTLRLRAGWIVSPRVIRPIRFGEVACA